MILLAACIGLWLILSQGIFFLVALGAGYRIYANDVPPEGSPMITWYFLAVLGLLGLVLWMCPGNGVGI